MNNQPVQFVPRRLGYNAKLSVTTDMLIYLLPFIASKSWLWKVSYRKTIMATVPKAATVNKYEPIKLEDTNQKKVHLTVNGQGTVAANVEPFKPSLGLKFASIILGKNHHREKTLWLDVSNGDVTLCGKEAWRFKLVTLVDLNSLSLLYFPESSKYIWVSICKGRALIKFGHGYMLESNVLVRFEPKNPSERDRVSELIGSIEKIRLSDEWNLASPLKFWILPVVHDPNPMISEANDLSTVGINHNLPEEAIRLFARIRGAGVTLNDEQIAWINYSLATEGCKLHTILKQKEQNSNVSHKKNKGYLRFGIGINVGDSIHVPFVLELWPIGRESVIHSHGDEVAMIKLLHGCIEVSYYNPLANENNQELKPFKKAVLKKGDITWMTPEFYQTHKLENLSKDSVSISLQCYSYMGIDNVHYEHFDYINEIDHKLHKFNPTSDMPTLEDMLNMVQGEYMRAQAKGKIS